MSDNLVSEPMTVEDSFGSRIYPVIGTPGLSVDNILMESQGPMNCSDTQQHLSMSNIQSPQSQQVSVAISQEMSGSHSQVKLLNPVGNNTSVQQMLAPNRPLNQMQTLETKSGERLSLPNKRKPTVEHVSIAPPTKKVAQTSSGYNSCVMPASTVSNRKVTASVSNSPRIMTSSKKKLPADSTVNRSQSHAQKNRHAQADPPIKVESGSSSVRFKLKNSLAEALALVLQGCDSPSNAEKKDNSLEGSKMLGDTQSLKSVSDTGVVTSPDSTKSVEPAAIDFSCPTEECRTINSSSAPTDPRHRAGDSVETWKFVGDEYQSNPVLSYEDASFNDGFFGKDELLMGNGLSWAMELHDDNVNVNESEPTEKAKLAMYQDTSNNKESHKLCSELLPSPEYVASEIEAELFKLYGGVNKKYKEKGRSLLFNLKDKSNPELRERVMSGKIPPEKLCSMTAEELASKELSEWRIAKAEELDQMKVLPDTPVDLRRLVKKTHKGEFQVVELERDVSVPVDIGGVSASVDQPQDNRRKVEHSRAELPVQGVEAKVKEDNSAKNGELDGQCQLTIPTDSGDVMHTLMVDDMKDLPPIVSLDEFMESLDKEPPFENLHGGSRNTPGTGKESSNVGGDAMFSDQISKDPGKKTLHKSGEVDSKSLFKNPSVKSTSVKKGPYTYPGSGSNKGERVWEGQLQLSISSMANFVAFFRSGEKTCIKDWPRLFEIKGRVRLDAFQKFLQDLPMSRSRAVMVVHFALAEGCTDSDCKHLEELVDSYVADQRLGFAEPATGFEIYFMPPQTASVDMLTKQLAKEYTKTLKSIDNGLIGIVVWRKAHVTAPTTTALHKDNAKGQQQQHYSSTIGSSRTPHEQKDLSNSNVNVALSSSVISRSRPVNNSVDDDDDVPPGFGPPTTKPEDDDLPEFNFSIGGRGGLSPSFNAPSLSSPTPSRSVDQVRQLIQKYGKTENDSVAGMRGGIALQRWDDDDDDIPEWQPELPPPKPHVPLPPPPNVATLAPLQQSSAPAGGRWWRGGPGDVQPNHGKQYQDTFGVVAGQKGRQWRSDGNRSRASGL